MSGDPRVKLTLALVALLGVAAYLVVVDLGVNAGRVHHGVTVPGVELGSMTEAEAIPLLEKVGAQLETAPLVFSTPGFDCRLTPAELGWGPQPYDTFRRAMAVGRSGGIARSLRDRVAAWLGGIQVGWAGSLRSRRVRSWLDDCEELAQALHVRLDRAKLLADLRRLVETWPRDQVYELPVAGSL